MLPKMELASKVVKIDSKIIISIHLYKPVKLTVGTLYDESPRGQSIFISVNLNVNSKVTSVPVLNH